MRLGQDTATTVSVKCRRELASLTDHLDDHALASLAVKLRVVDLLPRPQVEFSVGHGYQHLMPDQQVFQMRVTVGLTGAVVSIRSRSDY